MFKSQEHQIGYENLRNDYEVLSAAMNTVVTQLAEKTWDELEERFYDEVMNCFEEQFLIKVQTYAEKDGTGIYLDGFFDTVDYYLWCTKVPHYLIEAYEGYYDDDMQDEFSRSPTGAGDFSVTYKEWSREWVLAKIHEHTPREQLKVYLEWNGILGWQSKIENILLDFPLTKN